ncbi:hypothetical protein BT63DRAFT_421342, partial [Microthyrium microscopicum]
MRSICLRVRRSPLISFRFLPDDFQSSASFILLSPPSVPPMHWAAAQKAGPLPNAESPDPQQGPSPPTSIYKSISTGVSVRFPGHLPCSFSHFIQGV